MSYERQRASALRMVKKFGAPAVHESKVTVPNVDQPWKAATVTTVTNNVHIVAFADDGVSFVNHNVQGDVKVLTIVSTALINIRVGDVIKTPVNDFAVKIAKPLDPDLKGAILWAALVQ